jgi:thiamine-phosphate pyrophosphorylase
VSYRFFGNSEKYPLDLMQVMLPKGKSEFLSAFPRSQHSRMMELPRIQYITHPEEDFSNLNWLECLKSNGISWVQLRIKEYDLQEFHPNLHYRATFMEVADLMREKTSELGMILTINDQSDIARFSNADGLHFGLKDELEDSEREGFSILGATANSIDDMRKYKMKELNYFGVGPFQFTSTKKKLSPALGIQGYSALMDELKVQEISVPIFAIGGIEVEDIKEIMQTGVYGVALSGCIHRSKFDESLIKNIVKIVEDHAR